MIKGYDLHQIPETEILELYFEGSKIGILEPSTPNEGFFVYPIWRNSEGYFKSLETACVELVFLYWKEHHAEVLC